MAENHIHVYKQIVVKPTCTSKGYTLYKCDCGDEYKSDYTNYISHVFILDEEKAATCSNEGFIRTKCKNCGATKLEIIRKKTSHRYSEWRLIKEPTCSQYPIEERKCLDCGLTEKRGGMKLEHQFDDWVIIQEQTCTQSSLKKRKCKVCGYIETEEGPYPSHDFGDWTSDRGKNCNEIKLEYRICKKCGYREERAIYGLPHDFSEWTESPINDNSKVRVCKNCGFEQEISNLTNQEYELVFGAGSENGKIVAAKYCGESKDIIIPDCITHLYSMRKDYDRDGWTVMRKWDFKHSHLNSLRTNKVRVAILGSIDTLYVDSNLECLLGGGCYNNLYVDSLEHFLSLGTKFEFNNLFIHNNLTDTLHFDKDIDYDNEQPSSVKKVVIGPNVHKILLNANGINEIHIANLSQIDSYCSVKIKGSSFLNLYFDTMKCVPTFFKMLNMNFLEDYGEKTINIYIKEENSTDLNSIINKCKSYYLNIKNRQPIFKGNINFYLNNKEMAKFKVSSHSPIGFDPKWIKI